MAQAKSKRSTPSRGQVSRAAKRHKGLREVRLWLPDSRDAAFRAEIARQAALVGDGADAEDALRLSDEALSDALSSS